MDISKIPEWKLVQVKNKFILKISSANFDHENVIYKDDNITLCHLLTVKNIILGYSFEVNNKPQMVVRPLSVFLFYDDKLKEKILKLVYNDKLIRLFTTNGIIKNRNYSLVLRWVEDDKEDFIIGEQNI